MSSFIRWLEYRDPIQRWAREIADSQTDPVVLRRTQKKMEAENEYQRKRLGMKRDPGRKVRRGL